MKKRKVTNYTEEFKQSSAKLAAESEQSISKTAQELGINMSTLHGWVKKYYPDKDISPKTPSDDTQLESEIKRLRKELNRVTLERDILKKATAYFAVDKG